MNDKHTHALEEALHWIKATYQPTGIVVSGSIVRGNPNSGSDFDIVVLHEQPFRQRVQKLFNSVPCEIFVNTPQQIRQYFEQEWRNNRPVMAHMLTTGRVVAGGESPSFIALLEAAASYAGRAPNVTLAQIQFRQYGLATLVEDAVDLLPADPITALYIMDKAALEAVEFAFQQKNQPLPRIKERLQSLPIVHPLAGPLLLRYYYATLPAEKLTFLQQAIELLAGHTAFFEWSSSPEPC